MIRGALPRPDYDRRVRDGIAAGLLRAADIVALVQQGGGDAPVDRCLRGLVRHYRKLAGQARGATIAAGTGSGALMPDWCRSMTPRRGPMQGGPKAQSKGRASSPCTYQPSEPAVISRMAAENASHA